MSSQVVINYEAISIECRSICEVAAKQLCQIDALLHKIDEASQSLQSDETTGMKRRLQARAAAIKSRIEEIVKQAELVGRRGQVSTNSDFLRGNDARGIVAAAQSLSAEVNGLTTDDIANYEALLNGLLNKKVAAHNRDMRLRASGTVAYNAEFSSALVKIEDEALKGFIYLEWLDNRNAGKSFEELKALAQSKMKDGAENYFRQERKRIIGEIESEMRAAKLDDATISEVLTTQNADTRTQIADIRKKATEELVGEAVRKKTLKVVMECIESKGFIVDKKNIKLQREKNEVVMLAQKASGESAEFRVMLDGKFIYRFDGYEGQACQNDIQPFMQDLADIYGIKVTNAQEIWANPDKISTQKYQQIKTKTNEER
ncbi:MAG: hypothetical protein LBQ52_10360 [Helicobacteraceae bacterium]|jgi:hypothetical protein|nr:hypothetical protein [Helicobacteraceae bacterium]